MTLKRAKDYYEKDKNRLTEQAIKKKKKKKKKTKKKKKKKNYLKEKNI